MGENAKVEHGRHKNGQWCAQECAHAKAAHIVGCGRKGEDDRNLRESGIRGRNIGNNAQPCCHGKPDECAQPVQQGGNDVIMLVNFKLGGLCACALAVFKRIYAIHRPSCVGQKGHGAFNQPCLIQSWTKAEFVFVRFAR